MSNNTVKINDHLHGNFEWEIAPTCCESLIDYIESRFVYVSNITDFGYNNLYMMPLKSDGTLLNQDGISIRNCPWCGKKIQVRKKYAVKPRLTDECIIVRYDDE